MGGGGSDHYTPGDQLLINHEAYSIKLKTLAVFAINIINKYLLLVSD